jgi:hypothetical protein
MRCFSIIWSQRLKKKGFLKIKKNTLFSITSSMSVYNATKPSDSPAFTLDTMNNRVSTAARPQIGREQRGYSFFESKVSHGIFRL